MVECPRCHRTLEETEANFYYGKTGRGAGKRASRICRDCKLSADKARNKTPRGRKKCAEATARYIARHPNRHKACLKNWRDSEEYKAKRKEYRKLPHVVEAEKKYAREHPEVVAKCQINTRRKNPGHRRIHDPKHMEWAKDVKVRAGWKSEVSGDGGYLNSHHLFPWYEYPDMRFDSRNGVCLTAAEHLAYHTKWGMKFDPLAWMEV